MKKDNYNKFWNFWDKLSSEDADIVFYALRKSYANGIWFGIFIPIVISFIALLVYGFLL